MTVKTKTRPGFYPVYCCNEYLAEVPASTSVKCPHCNKWQHIEGKHSDKMKGDK